MMTMSSVDKRLMKDHRTEEDEVFRPVKDEKAFSQKSILQTQLILHPQMPLQQDKNVKGLHENHHKLRSNLLFQCLTRSSEDIRHHRDIPKSRKNEMAERKCSSVSAAMDKLQSGGCCSPATPKRYRKRISTASSRSDLRNLEIKSPETGRILVLDETDIETLQDSWNNFQDKSKIIREVFQKFFALKPELAGLFQVDLDQADWWRQLEFVAHSRKFIAFFDWILDNLNEDNASRVTEKIRVTGERHYEIPGVSFTADNWLPLKNCFVETICATAATQSDFTRRYVAWAKLLTFIVAEIKHAYFCTVRQRAFTI